MYNLFSATSQYFQEAKRFFHFLAAKRKTVSQNKSLKTFHSSITLVRHLRSFKDCVTNLGARYANGDSLEELGL